MGVTIHYMDKGLDTGDIIVQQEVTLSDLDTLKTAYDKLHQAIQALFMQHWPNIRTGQCLSFRQTGKGSFHRIKDKETLSVLFAQGWDTPIAVLKKQARQIIK
jgi:methionyl-tRNA formyltransferase